ncbi:type II CAAX prenyl endopeptidase Rce1 family protein [Paenibacillus nitricinens]|uniref:CPBP family intramembrane glutamic endopeptidase n=1 Tax=Paenibacillus TaxID=44249 RepID=UPI00117EB639|nr:CPBP family intramembrane glutamic endopeptidase [Paenibacillus sp. VTT E-133280]
MRILLSDKKQSLLFIIMVWAMALGMLLLPESAQGLYGFTPLLTVFLMMFLIVRDGYRAEGWRRLGFRFRGGKEYILALVIPLISLGAGYAVYWTGWASSLNPPDSWIKTAIYLVVYIVLGSLSALGEEIGWRGWLLPRFQWMGRVSSSITMGFIWAIWHYPAILGPRAYHSSGNRWLVLTLFTLSVVFAGIIINELRLTSGSIWPAVLLHGTNNALDSVLRNITSSSSPMLEYVAGESGWVPVILYGAVAVWILNRNLRIKRQPISLAQ